MLQMLDAIIERLRTFATELDVPSNAIVRGRIGTLDLGIQRGPGLAVFLVPGDMAAVTAGGTAIDDPAFTLVVGIVAAPERDSTVALAAAYERARLIPGILAPGFAPVWAADAIEPLDFKSDRASVTITGLVYDRGVTE